MQRKALGKGLKALLPVEEKNQEGRKGGVFELSLEEIEPNRFQPRQFFDDEKIEELAASIKEKGIMQPVVVQKRAKGYELIAGERRWRASQLAGLKKIPALVKEVSDAESLELALIENIQRENLNPIEEGRAYQNLIEEFGLTQENLGKRVGKERSTITNTLRLLKLPLTIQDDIADGGLTMGHARALLSLKTPKEQIQLRDKIVKSGLSVRAVEKMTSDQKSDKPINPEKKDIFVSQMEEKLQRALGAKCKIVKGGNKGRIEINFFSDEELEGLLLKLTGG